MGKKRSTRGKAVRVRYVSEGHERKNNELRAARHKKRIIKMAERSEKIKEEFRLIQEFLYKKTGEKRAYKQIRKDFKKNNTDLKEFLLKVKKEMKIE